MTKLASKWKWIAAGLGLAALLVWVWPGAGGKHSATVDEAGQPGASPGGVGVGDGGSGGRPGRGIRKEPRVPNGGDSSSPEVNRLLSDSSLADAEVVSRLKELAADRSLRGSHRLEALTHGLNLDPAAFASLSADPELPADLADPLLAAIINFNEAPALQVEVYMNLTQHIDPEVSSGAKEMLAFRVGDDQGEMDIPTLLREGRRQIGELKKSTNPQPAQP